MAVQLITGENVEEMAQARGALLPGRQYQRGADHPQRRQPAYHLQLNWLTGSITITEGLRDAG